MATVEAADAWWHSEEPERRVQIFKFLSRGSALDHPPVEGQLEIPMPRRHRPPQNRS